MIFCNKCGGPLDARGVCQECASLPFPAPDPIRTPTAVQPDVSSIYPGVDHSGLAAGSKRAPQKPSSFPPPLVVGLGGVGILAVAVLIYFAATSGTRSGRSNSTPTPASPTPTVGKILDFGTAQPSPTPSRVNPTPAPTMNPNPPLPDSFRHDYEGTIGRDFRFSVTLARSGRVLSGRASTSGRTGSSWDRLEGTIDADGNFKLVGYERGEERVTGDYEGRIRDRTVSGSYTSRLNNKTARFHLSQQD